MEAIAQAPGIYRSDRPRSESERLVAHHTEWSDKVTGFVTVNPDPVLLTESRRIVEELRLRHQGLTLPSRLPDVFVVTMMGDYFRATTLLPNVPPSCGILGGNGIGRTIEQAMELASLHAMDVLCDANIPVFEDDPQRQKEWEERRGRLRLVTCDQDRRGSSYPARVPPPGYQIEGTTVKPVPDFEDVRRIIEMPLESFAPVPEEHTAESLIAHAVEYKSMILTYCRRTEGIDATPVCFASTRGQTGRRAVAYNIVALPIYLPKRIGGGRLLATGISLKRKDADRCCFLHAVQLLEAFGVDAYKDTGDTFNRVEPVELPDNGGPLPTPLRHPLLTQHMQTLMVQQEEAARIAANAAAAKRLY